MLIHSSKKVMNSSLHLKIDDRLVEQVCRFKVGTELKMVKMVLTENCLKLKQGTSNLLQKRCVYTFTNLLPVCQLAAGWGTCAQHRATAKKDGNIPKSACFFM